MIDYVSLLRELGVKGRVGGMQFLGRCPLHNDNRPSFSVNTQNGLWICHAGCGQGQFPQLVQRVLGFTTLQAEAWLRTNARSDIKPEQLAAEIEELLARDTMAPKTATSEEIPWLQRYQQLNSNTMPIWFLERGFTWETVARWDLRWDSETEQVVIPVQDLQTRMVGTVSRSGPGVVPKYVNSHGLPKSKILFGFSQGDAEAIIIVEGPLDAIWCWEANHPAVALLGLQLSETQIGLLQERGVKHIILAMDADEKGQTAQTTIARQLFQAGWLMGEVFEVTYPEGIKDMQECSVWQVNQVIIEAQPIIL